MAADADAPDGELSKTAAKPPSPATPDHTEGDSTASPDESQPTAAAKPESADGDADESVRTSGALQRFDATASCFPFRQLQGLLQIQFHG